MSRARLNEIDRAKGLAILLVVIGHVSSNKFLPVGTKWYLYLKDAIYHFHMPFFMFLSGFLYFFTYKQVGSIKKYFKYAVKKFNRLFPAFFIFGSLTYFGKLLASSIITVHSTNEINYESLLYILIEPSKSPAISLWYIYVLLELFLIMPLVVYFFRNSNFAIVTIGIVLYFLPSVPTLFMLDTLCQYFIYFLYPLCSLF